MRFRRLRNFGLAGPAPELRDGKEEEDSVYIGLTASLAVVTYI